MKTRETIIASLLVAAAVTALAPTRPISPPDPTKPVPWMPRTDVAARAPSL